MVYPNRGYFPLLYFHFLFFLLVCFWLFLVLTVFLFSFAREWGDVRSQDLSAQTPLEEYLFSLSRTVMLIHRLYFSSPQT